MKTYNLLNGKVLIDNTSITIKDASNWHIYRNKFLSIIAGLYIFDRVDGKLENGFNSIWDWVFTSVIYVPLAVFVAYWLYLEFIRFNWTNKIKVDALEKIIVNTDNDNPLNTDLELKAGFLGLDLSFRTSENEHTQVFNHLRQLNSRFVIQEENP